MNTRTNLEILVKQLNQQGGTIHGIAEQLGTEPLTLLNAEFVDCPSWAKAIKMPCVISPESDKVESVHPSVHADLNMYVLNGWRFCK